MSHLTMTGAEYAARQGKDKAAQKQTPLRRMQALGRLKTGAMNKTEQAYSELLKGWASCGIILWHRFEGLKLRLADNTFYTPDFAVMSKDGVMELHEVKGFMQEDANVKIKVAAEMYPFRFFIIRKNPQKDGGGWNSQEVGNGN